jgi:hypothetical protein
LFHDSLRYARGEQVPVGMVRAAGPHSMGATSAESVHETGIGVRVLSV